MRTARNAKIVRHLQETPPQQDGPLPHLNPILKHTGLLEWIYGHHMIANPDSYFKVRKQIPQLEQMWKAELFRLADECECNSDCMYDLMKAPQSTSLSKALGLDKQRLERLRRSNGGTDLLYWLQTMRSSTGSSCSVSVMTNWYCAASRWTRRNRQPKS